MSCCGGRESALPADLGRFSACVVSRLNWVVTGIKFLLRCAFQIYDVVNNISGLNMYIDG